MDVRLARPTDAPLVLALALDDESHLVKSPNWPRPNSAVDTLTRAMFPLASSSRTWIARDDASAALLEARPRKYVLGWDIARLVVRGDHRRVLPAVLQGVTDHLQSKGAPRLFARCEERTGQELKPLGFQTLVREYVLIGGEANSSDAGSLPIDSRYRMPQDAWPLHQLESEVTPALIRQLEGMTSADWTRTSRGKSEIVVERDGKVIAWIGWGVKVTGNLYEIGMLVHPEHRELGPDLLEHVLSQGPADRSYVARVREYQGEVLRTFLESGFEIVAEEILMVKHARVELARPAKARLQIARVPSMRPFQSRQRPVRPAVPRTFCQTRAHEEVRL